MTYTTQVLSDEQIFKDWCKAREESTRTSDQVRAFARSVESATLKAVSGWQSMDTMPKEGKFLVFMPTQRVNQIQAARRHNGLLVIGNVFAFDMSDKPTHWQPLPPAPQPTKGQP